MNTKWSFAVLAGCATLLWCTGCGRAPAPAPTSTAPPDGQAAPGAHDHAHDDHHHHDAGPHGGTLVEWGGGAYHAEFTVNHDTKEATVYILGNDAKSPAPVKEPSIQLVISDPMTEIELAAKPLEGEAEGTSSRFVGTHDTLGIVKGFAGSITGVIDGTPYTGDFKEEPHGGDHKH